MADADRTEEATPHKLTDAKRKGQVANSRDLVMAAAMTTAVAMTTSTAFAFLQAGESLVTWATDHMLRTSGHMDQLLGQVVPAAAPLGQIFATGVGAIVTVVVLISVAQTGFVISTEPLAPRFDRVNPQNGLQRLISKRNGLEQLKNIAKAAVLLTVGYFAVRVETANLPVLPSLQASSYVGMLISMATRVAWKIVVAAVIIAIVDVVLQQKQFREQMRMTRQEIIDEYKMTDGDPRVKARVKRLRRQMAKRLRMNGVREARVVVTNPTHYAVALAYQGGDTEVPRVVAKGQGYRAERIKALAREHGVRILEAPPLARALFKLVDVDKHVPPSLYLATAEILVMVDKLESSWAGRTAAVPPRPPAPSPAGPAKSPPPPPSTPPPSTRPPR